MVVGRSDFGAVYTFPSEYGKGAEVKIRCETIHSTDGR
jgi:hypothetical protein